MGAVERKAKKEEGEKEVVDPDLDLELECR